MTVKVNIFMFTISFFKEISRLIQNILISMKIIFIFFFENHTYCNIVI